MSDALNAALADLETALVPPDDMADGAAWNRAVDGAVDRVLALGGTAAVAPLLCLLDDDHEFQDVLWSLLHAAESIGGMPYIAGLLEAVPVLAARSPDWAGTLTGRVLNSPGDRLLLAQSLADAPHETRAAFHTVFDALRRESPEQFSGSVWWVTTRLA